MYTTVFGGAMATIGAVAGASVAEVFSGNIDAARRKVDRCKEQVQSSQSDVNSTRKKLSDTETQIASIICNSVGI